MKDWAKFLTIHLNGFNGISSPILSVDGFKKLHEPYPGQEYTYGGWRRAERPWAGGPVLTHDGSNRGNYATAWIAPRKNLLLLSVANIGDADEATDDVIRSLIPEKK
ncbi:MAG: hypothetical protein H7318_15595 [Oligoflexus sp.]|nr:hypothetical protein [Oligoflexus sp.]